MRCGDGTQEFSLQGWDRDRGHEHEFHFTGKLLAEESSYSDQHVKLIHDENSFAPQGDRCSACRWFEVRIYARCLDGEPAGWVVETVGNTVVPSEVARRQVRVTDVPRRVVAALVQQKGGGEPFLPATSKRVLDRAADEDERLADTIDDLLVFD